MIERRWNLKVRLESHVDYCARSQAVTDTLVTLLGALRTCRHWDDVRARVDWAEKRLGELALEAEAARWLFALLRSLYGGGEVGPDGTLELETAVSSFVLKHAKKVREIAESFSASVRSRAIVFHESFGEVEPLSAGRMTQWSGFYQRRFSLALEQFAA